MNTSRLVKRISTDGLKARCRALGVMLERVLREKLQLFVFGAAAFRYSFSGPKVLEHISFISATQKLVLFLSILVGAVHVVLNLAEVGYELVLELCNLDLILHPAQVVLLTNQAVKFLFLVFVLKLLLQLLFDG
jgi:hypothetical protein